MPDTFSVPRLLYPLEASLTLPGSKSHANRAIVCAALAHGVTEIRNATPCDDVLVMVEGLRMLGFDVSWTDRAAGHLRVVGGIPQHKKASTPVTIDCHNAGTALRFLASVASIVPGTWMLTGNAYMLRRPIADLVQALRFLGVVIDDTNGGLPITIHGGTMRGGTVSVRAEKSSQFLSSLLLVAPLLPQGLAITIDGALTSPGYVELTLAVMGSFGADVQHDGTSIVVRPRPYHAQQSLEIEGDWSAAGAWLVLNALTGSRLRCTNLSSTSTQADRHLPALITTLCSHGDVQIDCHQTPDQLMNLALMALRRNGTTLFTGARNLRSKECDRLHVLTTELQKVGVDIQEYEDGVTVRGPWKPLLVRGRCPVVTLDPHGDHRMVMAFALIGLLRGGVRILHASCIDKSYPSFLQDLNTVVSSPRPIAVIGMRGAGKSSLGRRIARALRLRHVDTDHCFVDAHGPIRDYIAAHGWDAFRVEEARIIARELQPGVVLSCGGGATETASVRAELRSRAIVVWLQASLRVLVQRLQTGKRPKLTSLPLAEEVQTLLWKRTPQYEEVATIIVPPSVPFSRQTPTVLRALQEHTLLTDLQDPSRS